MGTMPEHNGLKSKAVCGSSNGEDTMIGPCDGCKTCLYGVETIFKYQEKGTPPNFVCFAPHGIYIHCDYPIWLRATYQRGEVPQ